jgi:hypothetical protein
MMFFKRRNIQTPKEIAWDDKTVEWIAQSDQLDVHVTHILKTISLGRMEDTLDEDRLEWSVHGVMTFPKFYTGGDHVRAAITVPYTEGR